MADQLLSQADVDALVSSLSANMPKAAPRPAAPAAAAAGKPAPAGVSQKTAAVPASRPASAASTPAAVARPAPAPVNRPVQRPESTNDTVNNLNAKVAELTRQLGLMGSAMKRVEMLEKKIIELEARMTQKKESQITDQKIELLTEQVKKMMVNLKGTPGYGVRNNFHCDKCDDEGHVAVQFRCTKCGHERWYGWWPGK
jgi:hypothetical protein